jgi:SpoVK/Ycf46/Vps4 family AAA+-type ATPase
VAEPTTALVGGPGCGEAERGPNSLLSTLGWLDQLLEHAVARLQEGSDEAAQADPFRGVYISRAEAERLLTREPGTGTLGADGDGTEAPLPGPVEDGSRLGWIERAFGLSRFDVGLMLIALAPELDLRYERLYAYLQDDVTRRRPSVDLALNLLCRSAEARLRRRAHFEADATLVRRGLLQLVPDPNQVHPPLLAHYFKLDEQIVRFLLEHEGLDARLAPFCRLVAPTEAPVALALGVEAERALTALVAEARQTGQPLRLVFRGRAGAGKRSAAEALAARAGVPLLVVDLARALAAATDFEPAVRLACRQAWLQDALLYLDGLEALEGEERALAYRALLEAVAEQPGIVILAGPETSAPLGASAGRSPLSAITVTFPVPDSAGRRAHWQARLAEVGISLAAEELDVLAGRFRLTPGQIAAAAESEREQARWRMAVRSAEGQGEGESPTPGPTIGELVAAARLHSSHNLGALARKITPCYGWGDIVLPPERIEQLREICNTVKYRGLVYESWGFDGKLSLGKGLSVLFAGPPGTGKTMAAEIIAGELGLDLYKIDLATVVSKYIGETEKNLARIFGEAESSNAILFFDEADALFGKRSEVRDSHDRYANIEISYLLQRMEEYQGVVILATNLRRNMDEAFLRRIQFAVEFPFPAEQDRRRIWETIWPEATPRNPELDLEFMARRYELAGGNIRNIALAAAFLAADDGAVVDMCHLLHATRREYQKMGKVAAEGEFGHPAVPERGR